MKTLFYAAMLLTVLAISACKKKNSCIENFVGEWGGNFAWQNFCSGSTVVSITNGNEECKVFLTRLHLQCSESNNLVVGEIIGDSIKINTQRFGLETISGRGSIYLNQFVLETNLSNGQRYVYSLNR